ncbi:hypothetical protein KY333_05485 [Candidatus Woesearchaeota archaeon]|nr:hypothetical protein [Candidatus Woesearchaeota archaeon]MBW2993893.1 hypothetical protein [Candidatus Woesearchaeota archaeon]
MNKKGFELSATMIVLIIITIVIFIGSMFFLKQFFTGAEEIKGEIERSTQDQIESLLRSGDLVAIPLNKKTISKGNGGIFGLGIRNVGADKSFTVAANFHKAFEPDGKTEILEADPFFIGENWMLYSEGPYRLKSNELKLIPISVTVNNAMDYSSASTKPGTYVFNVCVFKGTDLYDCDVEAFKTLGFPDELYNKKVYQLFVEIPA